MRAPRGLTAEEAAAWEKLATSVTPLNRRSRLDARQVIPSPVRHTPDAPIAPQPAARNTELFTQLLHDGVGSAPVKERIISPAPPLAQPQTGLDSHWERRLKSGALGPDFTLDLHGSNLNEAYLRLDAGLHQARALSARLVLVITGKPRPVDAADRGERRGAIRAKILDWLALGAHATAIAAIRSANRRHGGEGALYLVLRRESV